MNSALDKIVHEASWEFVERLGALNDEPYVREAIMKMAVRDVAWAMLETFDNQRELADQLQLMSELIEKHQPEDEHT